MGIKGTGKRLIPKRDIDYLEELKENHSDPSASWGGTEVVANPTPGEDDIPLTGLKVGDNKYKVSEKKIYHHLVRLDFTNGYYATYIIFNNDATPFVKNTFIENIKLKCNSTGYSLGLSNKNLYSSKEILIDMYYSENNIYADYINLTQNTAGIYELDNVVVDVVTEI